MGSLSHFLCADTQALSWNSGSYTCWSKAKPLKQQKWRHSMQEDKKFNPYWVTNLPATIRIKSPSSKWVHGLAASALPESSLETHNLRPRPDLLIRNCILMGSYGDSFAHQNVRSVGIKHLKIFSNINTHSTFTWLALLCPFYKWGLLGIERISNLLQPRG